MSEENSAPRHYKVLLVDDNEDDVWLTRRAFEKLSKGVEMHVAGDGVEALSFLRREGAHSGAPRPDFILVDLNMPRMDGHELLVELKRDEQLCEIPVIVLSTSSFQKDVSKAYREHASAYLTKPLYLHEHAERTQCFIDFWMGGLAVLPSHAE
jgi:CheY-like chemotaxis protein